MSESVETTQESAMIAGRDSRTRHLLAWVGIVAGVVFITAVVFFSGFALGRASGGHHGWHRGYSSGQFGSECPMMRNGGMMGPGRMTPDDMAPGMMRPGPSPSPSPSSSAAPSAPR